MEDVQDPIYDVIEGVKLVGDVNTPDEQLLANVKHSIRLGHPQIKSQPVQSGRVALVCGGPSLDSTIEELRQLVAEGAKIVTVNGAYRWCIEHNFIPSMQIVMDARATNAKFFEPELPRCQYALASQAHPACWEAVSGRPNVWIFHVGSQETGVKAELDAYYLKRWEGVGGGTTVGTRAIAILRMLGYLRYDIFGMDSCYAEDKHHAYEQPENDQDGKFRFQVHPTGHPEMAKTFWCAPWHVQQVQDFLQFIRFHGDLFALNVHGDGLLAYVLQSSADVVMTEEPIQPTTGE